MTRSRCSRPTPFAKDQDYDALAPYALHHRALHPMPYALHPTAQNQDRRHARDARALQPKIKIDDTLAMLAPYSQKSR
jgi:hypothetical protein